MTDKEKAIVTAYTGIAMLAGDKFDIFHRYIEEKMGRPIWTHELASKEVWAEIKEATREDFIRLCLETSSEAIPVWYIIRWYEKRYKLGSTVADDWERGFLKEKIAEMHDDFKNEKYLDNKQESDRFAQMVKEVVELYKDWEKENGNIQDKQRND